MGISRRNMPRIAHSKSIIESRRFGDKNTVSIRWQIVSIVMFSAISFSIFIGFSLSESRKQSVLLEEIQRFRYPIHAQLQEAFYQLELVQIRLEEAVLTSELETLEDTKRLADDFRGLISIVSEKGEKYAVMSEDIDQKFNVYYENSEQFAKDVIQAQVVFDEAFFLRSVSISESLEDVRMTLDDYKDSELFELTEAIEMVSQNARRNTYLAAIIGFAAIVITQGFALIFGRRVMSRVNHIIMVLKNIANDESDLSVRMSDNGRDEVSEMTYWFNTFMTRLERLNNRNTDEIKRLAYTDTLTKLPNRRLFNDRLAQYLQDADQTQFGSLAVMFLDLDNFKIVNDQMGHDAGDQLVKNIATRLTSILRQSDLIALMRAHSDQTSMVARMGGDEFMIILPGLSDTESIKQIAERIRSGVLKPMTIDDKSVGIGVSIGVSVYPQDAQTAEELISKADMAMYQAKESGRNSYCFFNSTMQVKLNRNVQIAQELKELIFKGGQTEISFCYQPKYDTRHQNLVGAEALFRWHSPVLGQVRPDEAITIAESSQLIFQLDDWVLNAVCWQINAWKQQDLPLVPIAINISAKSASHPDLVGLVTDCLTRHSLRPSDIEIEITETAALANMKQVAENINQLMAQGIRVAIDDFGAGNASLTLFRYCQLDTVKIDQLFVSGIEQTQNLTMLKGIVSLGYSLGVTLVAEGVEEQHQIEALSDIGCHVLQGYAISRPLNVNQFEKYVLEREEFI